MSPARVPLTTRVSKNRRERLLNEALPWVPIQSRCREAIQGVLKLISKECITDSRYSEEHFHLIDEEFDTPPFLCPPQ